MFFSKTLRESESRDQRYRTTLFEISRNSESVDHKMAALYSDFTEWGLRLERDIRTIRTTLIWIALLLIPVALRACDRLA